MSFAPGFVALANARDTLEAADRVLPPDSHALRADVLAHLAWTAPYCWDAERAGAVVARAEALARESNDPKALAFALSAKFYFANGPDTQDLAQSISSQIHQHYAEQPETSAPTGRRRGSSRASSSRYSTPTWRGSIARLPRSARPLAS